MVILRDIALVVALIVRLGEQVDGQDLALGVQRGGQLGEEGGERLAVTRVQILVVDVDPRVCCCCTRDTIAAMCRARTWGTDRMFVTTAGRPAALDDIRQCRDQRDMRRA